MGECVSKTNKMEFDTGYVCDVSRQVISF